MKNQAIHGLYALLVLVFCSTSCKTGKSLQKGEAPVRKLEDCIKAIEERNIDFVWFAAKAGGEFNSPQFGGNGSMQLRIKKDSLIWMIGKKFSIEGFRTMINKDSFFVVNRLEQFYSAEPLRGIHKMFGMRLQFEDMQQLLAGNVFIPDTSAVSNYIQQDQRCTVLANIDEYEVKYVLDAFELNLLEFEIKDRYDRKTIAIFDDYKKLKKHKVPYTRSYEFFDVYQKVASLKVDVNEIEINVPKSMIFSIPSHYERVRF